ncbi:hypothetical protein DFH08DRAFT_1040992 [Mycena albidolilacea]|uniref:Uncharacterized protein n=1 Tax=Mycena albidolilacea TaxID=1033008 RepID=A0AAD6ZBB4_9AGAR|nr:hypothetical protein DFH08DRAFT_1040992 [Mycena albidolilacea]
MSFFRSKAERQLAELKKFSRTFHTLNDNEDYDGIISALTMIVNGWDTMSSGDQESAVKQYTALYQNTKQRRGSWLSAPLGKLLGRSNGRRGTTSASATVGTESWESLGRVDPTADGSNFSQQLPRPHPPIMDPMNRINPPSTRPMSLAPSHANTPANPVAPESQPSATVSHHRGVPTRPLPLGPASHHNILASPVRSTPVSPRSGSGSGSAHTSPSMRSHASGSRSPPAQSRSSPSISSYNAPSGHASARSHHSSQSSVVASSAWHTAAEHTRA